ncbi:MAG: hypothetical protein HN916_17155 [Anaerolineae bacterium]|jgi:WXG100 family type VII secretion target|nr:hypothetical protein [Anaerolineae bacterium]
MTSIHMQTETVQSAARKMTQSASQADAQLHSLQIAIQELDYSWQGGSRDEFIAQVQEILHQLKSKNEALTLLAERVNQEVSEWEQVDQRGAASIRNAYSFIFFRYGYAPLTGGGFSNIPVLNNKILPIFTALSVASFLGALPTWLDSFLDKFFPQSEVISADEASSPTSSPFGEILNKPLPDSESKPSSVPEPPPRSSPLGEILNEPLPDSMLKPPPVSSTHEIYYDMPPKSQGMLLGSAACLPTSISMVTDYFHAQDGVNQTATPTELVNMLDEGDAGTKGVILNRMNDDVSEMGYQNVKLESDASFDDLSTSIKDGPVIVNAGVELTLGDVRDIQKAGHVNHAMVVKGINAERVVVNDPWSGAEKIFSREIFSQMWSNGGNYMVLIRP